jgi:hypothetical protein
MVKGENEQCEDDFALVICYYLLVYTLTAVSVDYFFNENAVNVTGSYSTVRVRFSLPAHYLFRKTTVLSETTRSQTHFLPFWVSLSALQSRGTNSTLFA